MNESVNTNTNKLRGVCYLILCHNNLEQVAEMVSILMSDDSYFLIHVDRKYEGGINLPINDNVYVTEDRIDVRWGDISVVDAELCLCHEALRRYGLCSHYILLSGSDFPVKSHEQIKKVLNIDKSADFFHAQPLPTNKYKWLEGGRRRLEAYAIPLKNHGCATIEPRRIDPQNIRQLGKVVFKGLSKLPKALKALLFYRRRNIPYEMQMYGGEMWWILSNQTLKNMIDWLDSHDEYYRYHRHTQVPDEIFMNSVAMMFTQHRSDNLHRYVSWGPDTNSPVWLTLHHDIKTIDECISNRDILFVRKIKDRSIINHICQSLR